ncbi:hypothetical protein TRFO_27052 [Tritrichomonas foetus]|uniref:Uncharacterized protein n=1 Tax=Tritrichomonas foetus TaxID=1144522 RepID=A0A1J4K346_9EUKA|nr:hypothetical protein TRFO_27052 [Tritrichomonas foetus]|eukprot:OHT05248.1 hypothetical protein TRFO_27052 [Tritrichomonas foetus]
MLSTLNNTCTFIIIGNDPSFTKDNQIFVNYSLLSTAQFIEKLLKNVLSIPQENIITFAYGKKNNYLNLLNKTQRKVITQLCNKEILFQLSSDLSSYHFFQKMEHLYKLVETESNCHKNENIWLFFLDHGNHGSLNKIPYIKIYQAVLRGSPQSIRIFSDHHSDSIISSIEQYSRLYQKICLATKSLSDNQTFILTFIPDYVMMAKKMSYNLFFYELDWLVTVCDDENYGYIDQLSELFQGRNYSFYKTLDPDTPVSEYIDIFFPDVQNIDEIETIINTLQIHTVGQLISAVIYYNHIPITKGNIPIMTLKNANIFLSLCGENEKNHKKLVIKPGKEEEIKLIILAEKGIEISFIPVIEESGEILLKIKFQQEKEIKLVLEFEPKNTKKMIKTEPDQSIRLNIHKNMGSEGENKEISPNEQKEKAMKVILKVEERNEIKFISKANEENAIKVILKDDQENRIKLMIKLEQEIDAETKHIMLPEHAYEMEFLTSVSNINFKFIYPPVSDCRVFATSGIYSQPFTFIGIPISPQFKINAGSPGASEIHEIFLRNSNDCVDFHCIEAILTISKDGKYKEYPLGTSNDKNRIHWMRFFPRHDSTDNFQYDRVLKIIQKDVKKKVYAMRGIRELVCNVLENLTVSLSCVENDSKSINLGNSNFPESHDSPTEKSQTTKKISFHARKEKMNEITLYARIAENEIRMISAISLISTLSFQLPLKKALKYIFKSLPEEYAIVGIISRFLGQTGYQTGLFSVTAITELFKITDEVLHNHGIDPSSASRTFVIKSSNVLRLMTLSSIALIIITYNNHDFLKNSIANIMNEQFNNRFHLINLELNKINCEKIFILGIHYVKELIAQELIPSTELLKNKIDLCIHVAQDQMITLTQVPIIPQFENPDLDLLKNDTEYEQTIINKFEQTIHNNVGTSEFLKAALLSIIMNPKIVPRSTISTEIINLISHKILNIRNTIVENIYHHLDQNLDPSIFEVIASKLMSIYISNKMEANIMRIIAFKLREHVLNSIFFPRNPKTIQEIEHLFRNSHEKAVSFITNSLTELLEVIREPFKFDEDFIENVSNGNYHEDNCNKNYQKENEEEENHSHQLNQQNEHINSTENQEIHTNINSQSSFEYEKTFEKEIANNFKKSFPNLGVCTAMKIISSYFLIDNPITIPMIEVIDKVIQDLPEPIQIKMTENDILQLVGLGKFDTHPLKRIRYRENKLAELDYYSKNDQSLIKIETEIDKYCYDDGIFTEKIQSNEYKDNYENNKNDKTDRYEYDEESENDNGPYNYKSKLTEEEIAKLRE